jgi:two-component system phosphate regulon sensor histidine kinase PhoR
VSETGTIEAIAREMHTGALVLDAEKKVLYANPFFVKSFPAAGEIEGRLVDEIIGDEFLLGAIERFMTAGAGAPGSDDEEIEIDEARRSFKVRLVGLEEGSRILLFLRDITEEKRVEAIKKDFVANVSHELRTPLASIKGYSETLLDEGPGDSDNSKEFLRIIDKHATRMSRLIDDLLILSRLESQQISVECAPLDMGELIGLSVATFSKQARDKGIELSSEVSEDLPKALGDRDRLEQVLVNLLDNAIKYTPAGGSVKVSAYMEEGSIRIDLQDTGIGIPPKDMPRIFERFYRVDKARSRELGGTGLGLAIVKHIMQGHGGRVWVESELGNGSCFSFTLVKAR